MKFILKIFFAILLLSFWENEALAQVLSSGAPNIYAPAGQTLTSAQVQQELMRNMARDPQNEAALWNVGYYFFRNYPSNQTTALAIRNGFLAARGETDNQTWREVMLKAANYWQQVHDYGINNVPAGQDFRVSGRISYGDTRKSSTLPMRSDGSRHQGFADYDYPGRYLDKRPPYRGRADNPYPGKYYPGMYPP